MTSFALPADSPKHEVRVEEPKHQQNHSMTSRLLAGSKLADLEVATTYIIISALICDVVGRF